MPFKKASISKCSSLRPERLGFKISLPMLKSRGRVLEARGNILKSLALDFLVSLTSSLGSSTRPLLKSLSTAALFGKEVLYWTNSFFSAASAKESSSFFFAGTTDRNPSIRFAAASFFGSDWLNKQPKNSSLSTDSISLLLSPLSRLDPLVHNKKSVICSANRDYIEVFHLTKI